MARRTSLEQLRDHFQVPKAGNQLGMPRRHKKASVLAQTHRSARTYIEKTGEAASGHAHKPAFEPDESSTCVPDNWMDTIKPDAVNLEGSAFHTYSRAFTSLDSSLTNAESDPWYGSATVVPSFWQLLESAAALPTSSPAHPANVVRSSKVDRFRHQEALRIRTDMCAPCSGMHVNAQGSIEIASAATSSTSQSPRTRLPASQSPRSSDYSRADGVDWSSPCRRGHEGRAPVHPPSDCSPKENVLGLTSLPAVQHSEIQAGSNLVFRKVRSDITGIGDHLPSSPRKHERQTICGTTALGSIRKDVQRKTEGQRRKSALDLDAEFSDLLSGKKEVLGFLGQEKDDYWYYKRKAVEQLTKATEVDGNCFAVQDDRNSEIDTRDAQVRYNMQIKKVKIIYSQTMSNLGIEEEAAAQEDLSEVPPGTKEEPSENADSPADNASNKKGIQIWKSLRIAQTALRAADAIAAPV